MNIANIGDGNAQSDRLATWVPRTAWPLAAIVLGLPLWWVLGLTSAAPIMLAVPMAAQLLRSRPIHLPGGFGWWLLFLVWVLLGVTLLWVDAPGATPGGGDSRLLVFALRLSWYVACTIVLLWVVNLDRMAVPDRAVHVLMASLFVIGTAGGLLGLLAPELEFRSAMEWVLPSGLRNNPFVFSLVHPETADVQQVLGVPGARPKAPFPYTNTWGSCMALSAVFFVTAAWRSRAWLRPAAALVVACAAVPIAYSLNRGLWLALAVAAVGGLLVVGVRRSPARMLGSLAALSLVAGLLWASPLGNLAEQRADNQHSNDRRGLLLSETVSSVSQGSPLMGFGSTRDVQGSFGSISGGATPDCPACGVPPLGTQGHLWLVLFSQGWLGLAFFLLFVVLALIRSIRCRTTNETVCTLVVLVFLLQLAIYDTLGLPLMVVMIAIGLVARERIGSERRRTVGDLRRELRRGAPVMAALTVAGAATGAVAIASTADSAYVAEVSVAITPAPVYLETGESAAVRVVRRRTRDMTLDTEVALLLSERAVSSVERETGVGSDLLRSMVAVTAVTNSHVLEIGVVSGSPTSADQVAAAFAESYLDERERYLDERRDHLLLRLGDELQSLDRLDVAAGRVRQELASAVIRLESTSQETGTVVRRTTAVPVRPPFALGATTGAALGLLCALVGIALSPDGTGVPRRRPRGARR